MSQFTFIGFLFIFLFVHISAESCLYGKVCGTYPRSFCCPVNTRCGTYTDRKCYTDYNGPPLYSIILFVVTGLFIFIMILKACITCCCSSRSNYYQPISSSNSSKLSRSGAVVCVAATNNYSSCHHTVSSAC